MATGPRYKLTLYITPDSSGKALAHLYVALKGLPYTDYELDMVDVLKHPEKARQAGIVDTPALVYHAADGNKVINNLNMPSPVRELLGIEAA